MATLFTVLFAVALLPFLLAFAGGYLRKKQFGRYDNHYPRLQQSLMTGLGARVLAAQKNAWEALVFYMSMCVLAYVSPIDVNSLAYPSVLFLLSRVAHALFYMLDLATYRSLVFFIGWFSCVYIGIKAVTA